MNTQELRQRYLQFFQARGHAAIPSAPLLPEHDPTVLFTTAGMHPLVPYLLGEPHPLGRRLVDVQRCIRTNDIDEVGDPSHLTFFEMLGNWSLGDYFKTESLAWSYEFMTQELGIQPGRLAVTVFAGDADAPRDELSASLWKSLGIPAERVFYLPKADNWWGPVSESGPCGPDSEIFFDTGRPDHPGCQPGCPCGKWFEIWNNVFMEYHKTAGGEFHKLRQQNVDTGMGLDRTVAVLNGLDDIFLIDTLYPLVQKIERLSGQRYAANPRPFRVIADHLRAASLAIADGARPSNVEAGYVVRRLIRRAVRYGRDLGIQQDFCAELAEVVIQLFKDVYPGILEKGPEIVRELVEEEAKFRRTLERGLNEYQHLVSRLAQSGRKAITGQEAFDLFQTYGFPLPLTVELGGEDGLSVEQAGFERLYEEHKEKSRGQSSKKFAGGLADRTEETTRLHTATHLLHAALRQVLGTHIHQMGSNITPKRLRFDFSHADKLSPEQLSEVERLVNEQISQDVEVEMKSMSLDEAKASGALAFFGEKYGQQVKVYSIGAFSREVCGGPHVAHTCELAYFKIIKEEAVGQGVRRIKAVLDTL